MDDLADFSDKFREAVEDYRKFWGFCDGVSSEATCALQ